MAFLQNVRFYHPATARNSKWLSEMNKFNTIGYLPLVDATTEVSSATTARYVSAVGLMILLYDCALTMKDEVSQINVFYFFGTYLLTTEGATGVAGNSHCSKVGLLHKSIFYDRTHALLCLPSVELLA